MKGNHIILTRIRFDDRKLMDRYLKVTRGVLVPALMAQTCKDFEWIIMCNDSDHQYLRSQIAHDFIPVKDHQQFLDFASGMNSLIQTRHDCDDWMSPTYIETIQRCARRLLKDHADKDRFLIQSQPVKEDIRTGKITKLSKYTDRRTSMHLTLVQRKLTTNIHARQHSEMWKEAQYVHNLGEGYTKWIIHGDNITLNRRRK